MTRIQISNLKIADNNLLADLGEQDLNSLTGGGYFYDSCPYYTVYIIKKVSFCGYCC